MPTYGKARDITINNLRNRKPWQRKSFAMSAVEGSVTTIGMLPDSWAKMYSHSASMDNVAYTVLSYQTPIAWVLKSGSVIVPDVRYSNTTNSHQSLCRVYL